MWPITSQSAPVRSGRAIHRNRPIQHLVFNPSSSIDLVGAETRNRDSPVTGRSSLAKALEAVGGLPIRPIS
jgi:hypothetical protein